MTFSTLIVLTHRLLTESSPDNILDPGSKFELVLYFFTISCPNNRMKSMDQAAQQLWPKGPGMGSSGNLLQRVLCVWLLLLLVCVSQNSWQLINSLPVAGLLWQSLVPLRGLTLLRKQVGLACVEM